MRLQDAELSNDIVRLIGVDSIGILRATNDIVSGTHDHDNTYAPLEHDHNADYAPSVHGHPEYSPLHDHPYAGSEHNHGSIYAPAVHGHNYAAVNHTHSYADLAHFHPAVSASALWLTSSSVEKTVSFTLMGPARVCTLHKFGTLYVVYFWDGYSGCWSSQGGVFASGFQCVSLQGTNSYDINVTINAGFQAASTRYCLMISA